MLRSARKLIGLSRAQASALGKAVSLLARARRQHKSKPIKTILDAFDTNDSQSYPPPEQAHLIAWSIKSASLRVPWRSDCLIQAMAAAMWLEKLGYSYELKIGVRKGHDQTLEAHAWLKSGDAIVTGNLPDLETYAHIPTAQAPMQRDAFR